MGYPENMRCLHEWCKKIQSLFEIGPGQKHLLDKISGKRTLMKEKAMSHPAPAVGDLYSCLKVSYRVKFWVATTNF